MGGKKKGKTEEVQPIVIEPTIAEAAAPLVRLIQDRLPGERFTDEQEIAILKVLAMCDGHLSKAARVCGVYVQSIWQIKNRNMGAFDEVRSKWKREHAVTAQDLASMLAAKMAERIETEDTSLRDLAVSWGITVQRGMDLAGDAVQTVKHLHSVDTASLEGARQRLSEIMTRNDNVIDVEFTDKGPSEE
jgi:hypothetical protein